MLGISATQMVFLDLWYMDTCVIDLEVWSGDPPIALKSVTSHWWSIPVKTLTWSEVKETFRN